VGQAIDREEVYEVTVNALTAKGAPATTPTWFNPGTVVNVEIVIPAGVAGLAGIRISVAGTQIFPSNRGSWLVGDNEIILRDVYNWPNSGRIEVEGYNEDTHAHTFQVRYGIAENPLPPPAPATSQPPLAVSPTGEVVAQPGEATETPAAQEPPTQETPSTPALPVETPVETPAPPVSTETPPEAIEPPSSPEPPPEAIAESPAEQPAPTETAPSFNEEAPPASQAEAEVEEEGAQGTPGGTKAPGGPSLKRKPASKTKTRTAVTKTSLPAGGWLPHGARFTIERQDQGQDFITDWQGPIIAPAAGTVVHVLSDKPFPAGFGPAYAVVHINTGPFGGKDWYIGHCTAAVKAGQKFAAGAVLAHADQGHVSGGGWCELGYAPNGYPGPMGDGTKFAGLFRTVVATTKTKVKTGPAKRKPGKGEKGGPKPKTTGKKRKPVKSKAKVKKTTAKRKPATKTPKAKPVKAKRIPKAKAPKPAKAPRAKRVKAAKPTRVKRTPAAKPAAAKRKKGK
jgi:hypothetical protein